MKHVEVLTWVLGALLVCALCVIVVLFVRVLVPVKKLKSLTSRLGELDSETLRREADAIPGAAGAAARDVAEFAAAADPDGYLDLVIVRDGKRVSLPGTYMVPVPFTDENGATEMRYGLYFAVEPASPLTTLRYSFYNCLDFVRMVRRGLVQLFTGKAAVTDMTGVVGIVDIINETGQSAETVVQGVENVTYLIAFIAVNLSVMNMLPIPALDGGHILTLLLSKIYELLRGKKPDPRIEGYIHYAGLILLLGLMALVFYNDIARIIRR